MSKKYFWLKLKDDFFKSRPMKKLRKVAGGDTYTIIYLKLQLLSLQDEGSLHYEGVEESLFEELALDIDESLENVQATMFFLEKCGLLTDVSPESISLPVVKENTGSEGSSADRVRKHREKNKKLSIELKNDSKVLHSNKDVTKKPQKTLHSNTSVTKGNVEIERELEKELEKEKDVLCVGENGKSENFPDTHISETISDSKTTKPIKSSVKRTASMAEDKNSKYMDYVKAFYGRVVKQSPNIIVSDSKRNKGANTFRLMSERDKRNDEFLKKAIITVFLDDFWKDQIKSVDGFRKKLNEGKFDQILREGARTNEAPSNKEQKKVIPWRSKMQEPEENSNSISEVMEKLKKQYK